MYWDQRGTGRSDVAARQDAPLTITRLLDDLDELIENVGKRFGAQRVVLLGHSFGTVLGVLYALEHPGRVAAVVSASQVVAPAIGDQLAYRHVADEAARRNDRHVLDALGRLGPPPHDVDGMLAMDRWLERYGGIFYNGRLTTGHLIAAALATQEVTVLDLCTSVAAIDGHSNNCTMNSKRWTCAA